MNGNLRTTLAGFAGALVVLGLLFGVVGIGPIVDAVRQADPWIVALLPLAALGWILAWGLSLRTVLGVLESPIRVTTAFFVYAAAVFANNVTPFGQAGGEPLSAYLISEVTEREYESGLAAIASVDALNLVPSLSLAGLGLAYFAVTATLDRQLRIAALAVGGIAVAIPVVSYGIWREREAVERGLARLVTPVAALVARLVPGREPPTRRGVLTRVESFFVAVERVASDRQGVALALVFATIGWLALSSSLWLSLLALGHRVPLAAALIVVPIGAIAGVTPLPGGLGGVETVLIVLLVPTTAVDPVTASAAVVLHRGATYWLPTLVGGGVTAAVGLDSW